MEFSKLVNEEMLANMAVTLIKLLVVVILTIVAVKAARLLMNRWRSLMVSKRNELHPEETDLEKQKRLTTLTDLLVKGINAAIVLVGILVGLETVGVAIGPILASAGVLGLAVGFGAQNLVKDVISGFFMLFENQIRQGDVAAINGASGTIEKINFRTVVLRDARGTVHYFPNGSITTVSNMSKGWSAMMFEVPVAYKEDLNNVMRVMREAFELLKRQGDCGSKILDDIEIFGLDRFADSAIIITARIKTAPLQQWSVGRQFRKVLKESFDREGIEIPFPQQSIIIKEDSHLPAPKK